MRAGAHARDGSGTWACIDVAHDGPGIPTEVQGGLFATFFQGDGSSTRSVGGLGMGPAFARELPGHMGGRLSVRSVAGEGCTFTLRVPAVSARRRARRAPGSSADGARSRRAADPARRVVSRFPGRPR